MKCNYVRQQKENKMTRAEERELQRIIRKKFYEELEKSLENAEEPPTYEEWFEQEK